MGSTLPVRTPKPKVVSSTLARDILFSLSAGDILAMAITAFCIGLIGGMFICLVNPVAGAAWFSVCILVGVLAVLDKIQSLLERQQKHILWFEKVEEYRFAKQYPNAPEEWRKAEAASKAAAETSEQQRQEAARDRYEAATAEQKTKREAKRKAAEPTFVSEELVPEIPPDFKPQSDVDFSALEEVAKPRRRRDGVTDIKH